LLCFDFDSPVISQTEDSLWPSAVTVSSLEKGSMWSSQIAMPASMMLNNGKVRLQLDVPVWDYYSLTRNHNPKPQRWVTSGKGAAPTVMIFFKTPTSERHLGSFGNFEFAQTSKGATGAPKFGISQTSKKGNGC
jgi:hypothetical protein